MAETYVLVYSLEDKRPGCVLLQAALGGTVPADLFYELFPSETWLVGSSGRMQRFTSTLEDLKKVSAITHKAMADAG